MNEVTGFVEIQTERNEFVDEIRPSTSKKPRFEYKPINSFAKPK